MSSSHKDPSSILEEFEVLKNALLATQSQSHRLCYMTPGGNWGDALIHQGNLKLFRDLGLEIEELSLSLALENKMRFYNLLRRWVCHDTLIFGGSGGWTEPWSDSVKLIARRSLRAFKGSFLLPSSLNVDEVPFQQIFVRDKYQSMEKFPQASFAPDLAFYLYDDPALVRLREYVIERPGRGLGFMLRTDKESQDVSAAKPQENRDISSEGTHLTPIQGFFEALLPFECIVTDRLHVGIACCLIGKRAIVHSGHYWKMPSVFHSSIAPYFSHVSYTELPTDVWSECSRDSQPEDILEGESPLRFKV